MPSPPDKARVDPDPTPGAQPLPTLPSTLAHPARSMWKSKMNISPGIEAKNIINLSCPAELNGFIVSIPAPAPGRPSADLRGMAPRDQNGGGQDGLVKK